MEIKLTKNLLIIVSIFLIASNLIIWSIILTRGLLIKGDLFFYSFLKKRTYEINLPQFRLRNSDGKESLSNKDLNAKLNILIFFTLEDCPICLYEAEFWGKASQKFTEKEVKLIGITAEKEKEKILRFYKEYGLSFTILYDENGHLKDRILSIKSMLKIGLYTPFKIFINTQKIIHVEGPSKDLYQQRGFPDRILELLTRITEIHP
ncbi:MAG: TlpA disulfide reductase family protein [Acidobacteriota bacterium]